MSTTLKSEAILQDLITVTNLDDFIALESDWNRLVTSHNNSLFLRHEFLRLWFESFAPCERLEVLTGWSPEGRLVAALPLIRKGASIRGIPVREIVASSNSHSCRFD